MKLKDVLGGEKKGGDFFKIDRDIEKKTLTIVEKTGVDDEIREHDTGKVFKDEKGNERKQKYYCLKVNDGRETKDLHCTWYALKQVCAVLPAQFYGAQFVIDVVRAKGVLDVRYLGTVPISNLADFEAKVVAEDPMNLVLSALAPPVGVHDSRIEDLTVKACKGDKANASFLWNMLKTGGKVTQKPDGCWVRT